ncbi:CIA30 family protein [Marinifilum sp. RC60d5]|uniref:CIA30 family protein n=1 Tax=Marinifilum sp. RC60d5 TaxID=3458414 RepID=UPI004037160B
MINILILVQILTTTKIIADFTNDNNLSNWFIVNDDVMGGKSDSGIYINQNNCAVFQGTVSIENNGGFAMVKNVFQPLNINQYSTIVLKVKGDSKKYQLRLKSENSQYYSFVHNFYTNDKWQIIEIPFEKFQASFRGQKLNYPNFNSEQLSEIAFLIGNKKTEKFKLEIMWIALK